jgi:hypothetical protein
MNKRTASAVIAGVLLTAAVGTGVIISTVTTACTRAIPVGTNTIGKAIAACPTGTAFTLAAGKYVTTSAFAPKQGDTFTGVRSNGVRASVIDGGGTTTVGANSSASGVRFATVVFTRFTVVGFRMSASWTANDVEASFIGKTGTADQGIGISMQGDNDAVTNSFLHDNFWYGVQSVNHATGGVFTGNEVSANNTACNDGQQAGGGSKFVGAVSFTVSGNQFHDNIGNGIWFDITGAGGNVISGNTSRDNTRICGGRGGKGISYEISCNATISNNIVTGNLLGGIDVINSFSVAVSANTVDAPSGAGFGIRVMADRSGNYGARCGSGPYRATNDLISGNDVTTVGAWSGIARYLSGEDISSSAFASNRYHTTLCARTLWKFNDGVQKSYTFAGFQAKGQDTAGSCS